MNPEREQPRTWSLPKGDRAAGTEDRDCGHDNREHLGGDAGGNVYYRCHQCGTVLIQEGSVSWEEHREVQKEALKEDEQGDNPLRGLLVSQEESLFDRGEATRRGTEASSGSVTVRLRRVIRRIKGR